MIISQMNSKYEETVDLLKEINPFDLEGNPRNVELWLVDVEKEMRSAVRFQFFEAVKAVYEMDRTKWVFHFPSQIIAACDSL